MCALPPFPMRCSLPRIMKLRSEIQLFFFKGVVMKLIYFSFFPFLSLSLSLLPSFVKCLETPAAVTALTEVSEDRVFPSENL